MSGRAFGIEELFFSTTDRKGIIRSGNRVFARVAGYAQDELIGKPHNVVRHPDMPRAVFQLLWDTIEDGRPIAAYVKNRASDGDHYWVLATVVPVADGYLSVRLKPTGPHFPVIERVYREVRALEREIEGPRGRERKAAIVAGSARLAELVAAAGYADYDALMRELLPAELAARDAALATLTPPPAVAAADAWGAALVEVLGSVESVQGFFAGLFARLTEYVEVSGLLADKSGFVLALADEIRLFSLNVLLAATRLGADGRALAAVAELMRGRSTETGAVLRTLAGEIDRTLALLRQTSFEISLGKLQAEITTFFLRELLGHGDEIGAEERRRIETDLALLSGVVADGCDRLLAATEAEHRQLQTLGRDSTRLERDLGVLRVLEVNGRIEAASAGETQLVRSLFAEIGQQIGSARDQLAAFASLERLTRSGALSAARRDLAAPLAHLRAQA